MVTGSINSKNLRILKVFLTHTNFNSGDCLVLGSVSRPTTGSYKSKQVRSRGQEMKDQGPADHTGYCRIVEVG